LFELLLTDIYCTETKKILDNSDDVDDNCFNALSVDAQMSVIPEAIAPKCREKTCPRCGLIDV